MPNVSAIRKHQVAFMLCKTGKACKWINTLIQVNVSLSLLILTIDFSVVQPENLTYFTCRSIIYFHGIGVNISLERKVTCLIAYQNGNIYIWKDIQILIIYHEYVPTEVYVKTEVKSNWINWLHELWNSLYFIHIVCTLVLEMWVLSMQI